MQKNCLENHMYGEHKDQMDLIVQDLHIMYLKILQEKHCQEHLRLKVDKELL